MVAWLSGLDLCDGGSWCVGVAWICVMEAVGVLG